MRVVALVLIAACGRIDFDAIGGAGVDAAPVDAAPLTITRLQIYDPVTDSPMLDVTNGGVFEISVRPNGICVVAEVAGVPGSVEFARNGDTQVENSAPFSSGGDETDAGNLRADHELLVGPNQLTVTAYELADAGGVRGPSLTVSIELRLPLESVAIARAGIIDDNDSGFVEIVPNGMYSVASLPAVADVKIETEPDFIGSVAVSGTSPFNSASQPRVENYLPYTALGPNGSFTPTPGTYTVTAVPFRLGNLGGGAGATYSVTFEIVP